MNELMTAREVAQRLRVEVSTVRRWVKQGTLEAVLLPHVGPRQSIRIKAETLNRVLAGEAHREH